MFDFPNSPTANQIVTGPNGATWQWDGVKWRANALWQGATVIASDTPPVNPPTGALWWDSLGGQLYVNYADPNSVEWVIANTGGIPDAPADGNTYARSNQQWVAITGAVAAAPNNTGRNLVHNGMFTIAQRGTGPFTGAAAYSADRWFNNLGGSDTISTVVNGPYHAGAPTGDESLVYYLTATFTGSASGWSIIAQRIENVARLSGKTLTLSFYANCASGTFRIGAGYQQQFGSGGSPSAPTIGNIGVTPTLTTSTGWQRYSFTFAMPSSVGKTFGSTSGTDFSEIDLWLSCGSATYTGASGGIGQQSGGVSFWGVQLEIGSVATPLAKRDPFDELALCQRFYQGPCNLHIQGYNLAAAQCKSCYVFPVRMRATPSVVFILEGNANTENTPSIQEIFPDSANVAVAITTSGNGYWNGHFTASADL